MIYFAENLPVRKITLSQIDSIINHATDVLGIPEDITLDIQFTYEIVFPQYGDADLELDDGAVGIIRINRRCTTEEIIVTLFHELAHIGQMMSGKLTLGEGKQRSTWYGREHREDYHDLPWEKEAFELEQYMMKTYKEKYSGLYG